MKISRRYLTGNQEHNCHLGNFLASRSFQLMPLPSLSRSVQVPEPMLPGAVSLCWHQHWRFQCPGPWGGRSWNMLSYPVMWEESYCHTHAGSFQVTLLHCFPKCFPVFPMPASHFCKMNVFIPQIWEPQMRGECVNTEEETVWLRTGGRWSRGLSNTWQVLSSFSALGLCHSSETSSAASCHMGGLLLRKGSPQP